MELGGLLVVAVVANTTMLALYGLIRLFPAAREHSPSPSSFLRDPAGYVLTSDSMLAQTSAWAMGLLVGASALSAAFAYRMWPFKYLSRRLTPAIAETSGWHQVFESGRPEGTSRTHVICEFLDGSSVAGRLAWFNTNPEEGPDRDIVLAPPLLLALSVGDEVREVPDDTHRMVVSSRDIRRIYVSYVTDRE